MNALFLNPALAAATVSALSAVPSTEVTKLDDLDPEMESKTQEAKHVFNTPIVRATFEHNFNQLVANLQRDGISLAEVYASAPPIKRFSGDGDVNYTLMKDFSQGTQHSAGGGIFTNKDPINVIQCHTQCHHKCHSNHSSRGWR